MDVILSTTAPIFFLIFLGFAAVRFDIVPTSALAGMSRLVLYFALPALVFTKLSAMDLAMVLDLQYIAAYAIGGTIAFFITIALSRLLLKSSYDDAGINGIGASMSNSAFIGFPVIVQFFDDAPTQALAMALMVENIIILPIALVFMESIRGGNEKGGQIFLSIGKRVASNPILSAVLLGVMFSAFDLSLPGFTEIGLNMMAQVSAPLALFVIGGSLVGITLKGDMKSISLVTFSKLIIFPAAVFLVQLAMPDLSDELRIAVVLFAAMPMFTSYPIICSKYGKRSFCASSLLITTMASFFTLSLLLRILS